MVLSCGEGPVRSRRSDSRTSEIEVKKQECAFVSEKLGACSVQGCKEKLFFENFGAVAGED